MTRDAQQERDCLLEILQDEIGRDNLINAGWVIERLTTQYGMTIQGLLEAYVYELDNVSEQEVLEVLSTTS